MVRQKSRSLAWGLAVFFTTQAIAIADFHWVSPASGGTILGSTVTIDLRRYPDNTPPTVTLDNARVNATWKRGPYGSQWYTDLTLSKEGAHTITIGNQTRTVIMRKKGALDLAADLADHFMYYNPAEKLDWSWGSGVFLYGLSKLPQTSQYLHDYYAKQVANGVTHPTKSDTCAGALGALALALQSADTTGLPAAEAVAAYIRTEPRNELGTIDHLGHDFFAFLFPNIWVDSLMMYAVFAAQYGNYAHDPMLHDFAVQQPLRFAKVLLDPKYGLFRHAYSISGKKAVPEEPAFWLRGNGWVMTSIVDILDETDPDTPEYDELVKILKTVAYSMAWYQMPTGLWDQIADMPGYTYSESSGTALVAYAMAKGVHRGWLDAKYLTVAKRAFAAVSARLIPREVGVSMPNISDSTNPGALFFYTLIPQVKNAPYGIGAYLLAASELQDEEF